MLLLTWSVLGGGERDTTKQTSSPLQLSRKRRLASAPLTSTAGVGMKKGQSWCCYQDLGIY